MQMALVGTVATGRSECSYFPSQIKATTSPLVRSAHRCKGGKGQQDGGTQSTRSLDKVRKHIAAEDHLIGFLEG